MPPLDVLRRPLSNLRISVTDRCNLRCAYCMPEKDYAWLPRQDILHFEEIGRLAGVFAGAGVDRVRLTGGEPLVRRNLPDLVAILARDARLRDIAMTTNGVLLAEHARDLRAAGLHRVTVSLDTLRADRFRALTRFDELDHVIAGIDAAAAAGFGALKIDSVVIASCDAEGKVHLGKVTEHSTKTGLKWGVVGGAVLGVIFPPSILASAAVLGGTGAVLGKARNVLNRKGLADELAGAMRPNTAGIVALVENTAVVEIRKAMAKADRIVEEAVDKQLAAEIDREAAAEKASLTSG